jgi:hypothetical protein
VVVWEHNSHIGDARATAMGGMGEWSIGQLSRERFGSDAVLVGFSTYQGTVTAASDWDAAAERKRVRPALPGSFEAPFHGAGQRNFLLTGRLGRRRAAGNISNRLVTRGGPMERQGKLIGGIILGAGGMYLLDPDRGTRRRSLLRDQLVHAGSKLEDGLAATARDTRNRAVGAAAELRSRFQHDQADDAVLHERVRSAIGRVASHPSAITVNVLDGKVTLSGPVLADEVDEVIKRVERVRGVGEVRHELEVHRTANGVPALQGPGRPREQRPELLQENWAPAIRVAMATIGGLLVLRGVQSRGLGGSTLSAAGVGLLTRAITNLPARNLIGTGAGGW